MSKRFTARRKGASERCLAGAGIMRLQAPVEEVGLASSISEDCSPNTYAAIDSFCRSARSAFCGNAMTIK